MTGSNKGEACRNNGAERFCEKVYFPTPLGSCCCMETNDVFRNAYFFSIFFSSSSSSLLLTVTGSRKGEKKLFKYNEMKTIRFYTK